MLSDLEILIGLGRKLGIELPSVEDVDAAVVKQLAAAPDFTFGDERYVLRQAQHDTVTLSPSKGHDDDDGLRVALQTNIFAGGGTSAHDDRIVELRMLPEAAVSAAQAEKLGITTCDYIDIESDGRTMHDLLVEVRAGMPDGVIALVDGLPDDPANLFGEGALVRVVNIRPSIPQGTSIPQYDKVGSP